LAVAERQLHVLQRDVAGLQLGLDVDAEVAEDPVEPVVRGRLVVFDLGGQLRAGLPGDTGRQALCLHASAQDDVRGSEELESEQ
jgi:hypothetical protein